MKKTLLLLWFLHITLFSQQHPLAIETATLLEPGHAQIEFGSSHFRQQPFPLSGLEGNLWKIGNLRFGISLSGFVELQTEGTLLNVLDILERKSAFNSKITTSNNPTADIGDFSLWTKFSVLNEYSSGIGLSVRFGVQLPNTSNESGLGIDEMNFFSSLLFQKHFAGLWTINTGLGVLGDPTRISSQHDVFTYGIEYCVPVGEVTYLYIQSSGRRGHNGDGVQHLSNAKVGFERNITHDFSIKLFGVSNFSSSDNAKGFEINAVYTFHVVEIKE
ncbi:MAG TPA: hypothetical protein DCQ28_00460 [Bacteroidetes bacterium]|nr:hypothetical protein [Bacteroidota bacterium]